MRPFLCCLAALITAAAPAYAQEQNGSNLQQSLGYEYQRKVKERLRGFGTLIYEELYDADRLFGAENQLKTTGGVSFDLKKRIRLEGGLGLYYTYLPEVPDKFEARLWQAVTLDWPDSPGLVRRYVLQHRFRLEERFQSLDSWDFAVRLRYRLSFKIPINKYTVEARAFYVPLKAEFYFPLGSEVQELYAQQARYSAGIGYVFNKQWTLELRYARQQLRSTINENLRPTDQFIELRLKSSFRIVDLVKSR